MSTIVKIIIGDISKLKVDCIVNDTNPSLLEGGGINDAIQKAAGPKIMEELRNLGGCKTGEAKITAGFDLPAKKVIHTVSPQWIDGNNQEAEELANCYKNSLDLAVKNKIKSIAFPAIGTNGSKFPKETAFKIAVESVRRFTDYSDELEEIYLVALDNDDFKIFKNIF